MVSLKEGTYEGTWEDDLCHGAGKQSYRNGDIYEGGWERNKVGVVLSCSLYSVVMWLI